MPCTDPLGCVPHCPRVFYTTPLGLCSALPIWGCAMHCPSEAVVCTALLELFSALPFWSCSLNCPSRALYSALYLLACALPCPSGALYFCTALLGHCTSVLPFWGTVLRTGLGWVVGNLGSKPIIFSAVVAVLPRSAVLLSFQEKHEKQSSLSALCTDKD